MMPPAAKAGAAIAPASSAKSITVGDVRRAWAAKFRAAGFDSPELDARLLVGYALSLDHAGLVTMSGRKLDAGEASAIAALAQRRLAHEPVARIVGTKEFWGLRTRCRRRDAGASAGDRDSGRGRARRHRPARVAGAAVTDCRSRHWHWRHPARPFERTAECVRRRYRREPRRTCNRARQCSASGLEARRLSRLRHGGGVAGPVRHYRIQPALYCIGRYRHFAPGGAPVRSSPRARRRTRRTRFPPGHCHGSARVIGSGRRAHRRAWGEPGGIGCRFIRRSGSCTLGAATRS